MQTREQRYAADVYSRVTQVDGAYPKGTREKERKQYGSMAHKLPVLIRTAGLVQALAFVDTRGKEPHRLLLRDLAATLGKEPDALLKSSRNESLDQYMLLTRQVLDALLWYKRFAESVLGVKASDAAEEEVSDS